MRILWWVLLMSLSMPAFAFNVGGSSRANFGAPVTEETNQEDVVAPRTHTATTYSSRYKFDKGVQTQGVQTKPVEVSGSTPSEVPPKAMGEQPVNISVGKKQAKHTPMPAAEKQAPAAAAQPTSSEVPMDLPPDASAAMAQLGQVQGMLQGLQNMMGGAGGGNAQGNNAGAMPDLSALMGGQKVPVKK